MLFNKILCNFCFHYLTTSPTCSEVGGAGDLVSQLIYLRKSQKEHQRCSEGGTIIPGSNGNTANSWGAFIISSITILRTTFYRTHT